MKTNPPNRLPTVDRTDRFWDLREQRRPTVWLVERVDSTPTGRPQFSPVQIKTPTKGGSRKDSLEVRQPLAA